MELLNDKKKIVKDFKENAIIFLKELMELLPSEGKLILVYIYLNTKVSDKEMIETFIKIVLPYKEKIINNDQEFFLDFVIDKPDECSNDEYKLITDNVEYIKELWRSEKLDSEDKKVVWQWLDLFIKLSEMYVENNS